MTNPNTTGPTDTTTTETSPEGAIPDTTPDTTVTPETTESESPNSEAAKYRVKLRETETERDTLAGRVTSMQRRECEAAVADLLEQPADLWDLGKATTADFYSDTDELNEAELRAAATALVESRPGLAKTKTFDGPRNWGQSSGTPPTATSSWDQVVKGR